MKINCFCVFVGIVLCIPINSSAQNSYFFNQKNLISVHVSANPRLVPMNQDGKIESEGYYNNQTTGIGRGTFYQKYNEDNELVGGNEKFNIMLNTSYARLFGGHSLIGIEFNYQKHYLTMDENSNLGYGSDPENGFIPLLASTPLFNIYDLQLFYGYFTSGAIAPNKHLLTFGAGVRIFSLDQNQNYRKNATTPFTDLSNYMEGYDESFIFFKTSINYTYRILLTKNLSFDIGVNANLGLSLSMDTGEGYIQHDIEGPFYERYFIKNKLGAETLYNFLYFRTGLSLAI